MGGPWRERGFDPAELRAPRPWSKQQAKAVAMRAPERGVLNRVVLAYIAAVAMSFGLVLSLLQHGW